MLQVLLVPAFLDRMPLSRVDHELGLHADLLQARVELVSLSDRNAGVVLAVKNQGRRSAVSDERDGRVILVGGAVRVRVSERDLEPRAAGGRAREAEEVGVTCLSDRGLEPRRVGDCPLRYFNDLTFPSTAAGYAVGQLTGGKRGAVVARTKDGGATWTLAAPETMEDNGMQAFFWNENTGLVTMYAAKTLMTADGGQTWNGIVTPFGGEHARYAMGDGLGVIIQYRKIAYSTNGGRSFSAREFPVPANVNEVVFPDAKHGYLVGEHGMIYRYRIVPADYNVKGMIPAPMSAAN
jgi:hypothetical protein